MSEIQRYRPTVTEVKATAYCGAHPAGEYVSFADHDAAIAAKDAEIERLRELVRRAVEDGWKNADAAAYLAKHKEGT